MRDALGVRPLAFGVAATLALTAIVESDSVPQGQSPDEAQRLAERIRARLVESRERLERYGYFEEDTEIQLNQSGREVEREARVFAVSPASPGGEPDSRLVSVNGKPPTPDQREEDDERRAGERTDTRSQSKSASQRRKEAVEDLRRGLTIHIEGRATVDAHDTTIVRFEPLPDARLQSRVARFIRAMRGRIWVTADGDIVKAEAELADNVSVGWGLIARIWKGSWVRARQHRRDGAWLPLELNAEAQGRTLLFRNFHTRYAVRYWGYRLAAAPSGNPSGAWGALRPALSPPAGAAAGVWPDSSARDNRHPRP